MAKILLIDDCTAAVAVNSGSLSYSHKLPTDSIEYWVAELAKSALCGVAPASAQAPALISLKRCKAAHYRFAARLIDPGNLRPAPSLTRIEQKEIEQIAKKYGPFRLVVVLCWTALKAELIDLGAEELDSPEKVCAAVMASALTAAVSKHFGAQPSDCYDWLVSKCLDVACRSRSESTPSLSMAYRECTELWMQLSREERVR